MTVLVIGHDGQLGLSLAAARKPSGLDLTFAGPPHVDLTRPETLREAVRCNAPKCVINAAAYTAVDKAETEPEIAQAVNADGPSWLAEICGEADIPLIHVSTDYVFDGTKPAPYVEDDAVAPLGVYGETKLAGERAVSELLDHFITLRTAWVISPYGNNFAKTMLRIAAERDELRVVADQVGTPTYAPHLADAIIKIVGDILARPRADVPWGLYHATGQGETSWFGLAKALIEASANAGGPSATVTAITTADYPTPAKRPANSRLDCTRLTSAFALSLPPWQDAVEVCTAEILARQLGAK